MPGTIIMLFAKKQNINVLAIGGNLVNGGDLFGAGVVYFIMLFNTGLGKTGNGAGYKNEKNEIFHAIYI